MALSEAEKHTRDVGSIVSHVPYRVLIVDDDPEIGRLLAELLQSPQRSVERCDNPQQALAFLEHNPVDVAFVDQTMPGMLGIELSEKIKGRYPRAHVVLCTGWLATEIADQPQAGQVDCVLQKPFNIGEVLRLANAYAR